MSRIGKQPVEIPSGVTIEIKDHSVNVKGPKGELKKDFHKNVKIEVVDERIVVTRKDDSKETRALHGLTRNLLMNMVHGVTQGFEKKLEIIGVGYRAQPAKNKITLSLGYSHPLEYIAPHDIEFVADEEKKNIITVKGIDKQMVGEVAAKIRSYRKPEPYKGKGIKYIDEIIARKAGKAAAGAGGAAGA